MKKNLFAFAVIVFILSACGVPATPTLESTTLSTSTAVLTNAPLPTDSTLFLVDQTGRLEYRFALFDMESKKLYTKNIDFSTTNWEVTIPTSRFNSVNGTEAIHYNPLTKEIVFVLYPSSYGRYDMEASVLPTPADMLSIPPFSFAIYKTPFESPNQFVSLYATDSSPEVLHIILSPQRNSLFMDTFPYNNGNKRRPEILKFDIGTMQLEHVDYTELSLFGKDLKSDGGDLSDLRLSPDGKKLYQLVLFGDKKWTNETLYLKTINLDNRSANYQEIVTGDGIEYGIEALSADGANIAFYTIDRGNNRYRLWAKNINSGKTISIPIDEELGNVGLFITSDGKKILVGLKGGSLDNIRYYWKIYDLNTNEYQPTPLDSPLAWDLSGRYLVGIKGSSYIIYDIETSSELKIGLYINSVFDIKSIQWR